MTAPFPLRSGAALLFAAAFLASPAPIRAQLDIPDLRIGEFMAENESTLVDSDGDAVDWIEIQNATLSPVDLGGYYLTDDPAVLDRWAFPDGVSVSPGGNLIVYASGKDRTADSDDLHTNFSLSSSGEYLALVRPDGVTIQHAFSQPSPGQRPDVSFGIGDNTATDTVHFVVPDANCTWHVPSSSIGKGWQMPGFDDSSWQAAKTGVGFGYDDLTGQGGNTQSAMQLVNSTIYIRVPFQVANPASLVGMTLNMRYEDGFAAFLNGHPIAMSNAPGTLSYNSLATASNADADAIIPAPFALDFAGHLLVGENILAIHGMNSTLNSSDVLFLPELEGEASTGDSLGEGFFLVPTPGAPNGTKVDGFVQDTAFDFDRGFYDAPFPLTITSPTPEAEIRYTLDGSAPTETSGTLYTGPIPISRTTIVRAIATRSDWVSTNVDTHTYLFPEDVLTQPLMRNQVTQDPVYGPQMVDSLKAIPTISLVSGLNINNVDRENERPVSVEMIFGDGTRGFQEDAGITRFGNYVTDFVKRQWRLYFRSEYGVGKLQYPVFDGFDYEIPPAEEFDGLDLRSGSHDMNQRGAYLSGRFVDDSMIEMGHVSSHGRFVHVYLNGVYWGQYHLRERWNAAMMSHYFGGKKGDYDSINANNTGDQFLSGEIVDGTAAEWTEIRNRLAGPTPFSATRDRLDIDNLIDFMLLWVSGGSESEFRATGSVPLGVGFKFQMKDADGYLPRAGWNTSIPGHAVTHNGPLNAMTEWRQEGDPDFVVLLADHIHRHFFNGGAMTGDRLVARLQRRVDETRVSFLSESARWDTGGNVGLSPAQWLSYQTALLDNHLPGMTAKMIAAFKQARMYPSIDAPEFSQHGGPLPGNGNILVTADGVIYYTTDGSDPRLPGGAVNPAATAIDGRGIVLNWIDAGSEWSYLDDGSDQGTAWRQPGFDDSSWQSGFAEFGYSEGDEATLISFGPDPASKHITTYFRKTFNASEVENLIELTIEVLRDDGVVIYLNGAEVLRDNMPAGTISYNTTASASMGGTPERTFFPFTLPPAAIINGENTIAVELHQFAATDSDTSFNLAFGGLASAGTPTVHFADAGTLKARVLNGATGEWSALNEAFFYPGSAIASADNLVVSEFNFHPAAPSAAEIAAGFANADLFEFLEMQNISSQVVNLSGMQFTNGITMIVPEGVSAFLDPGAAGLVVVHQAAFELRYGTGLPIIGIYGGNLRNSGETIELRSASGELIKGFTYDDEIPWPVAADGSGFSLVLRNPDANPDHNLAENWTTSSALGGSPGSIEAGLDFDGWLAQHFSAAELADPAITGPSTDNDNDGRSLFMEFALGGDPTRSEPDPVLDILPDASGDLILSYRRSKQASGLDFALEFARDLKEWTTDASEGTFETPSITEASASANWISQRFVPSGAPQDAGKFQFRLRVTEQ